MKWNKIFQLLAVMLMLLAFSHYMVLCRFLQYIDEIYKICVLTGLIKSDVIKLTSISNHNLLEVNNVTLIMFT